MRIILAAFILWAGTNSMAAGEPTNKSNLRVHIEGLKSGTGGVALTLFDAANEKHFPIHPEQALAKAYENLNGKTEAEIIFPDLAEGEYAVLAYHDEDSDKKMKRNFIGIPKEGYAVSNDAKGRFGPPVFKDAKFLVKKNSNSETRITLKMNY